MNVTEDSSQDATLPALPIPIAAGAELLGVSDKTLRRWIKAGRIHAWRRGPRCLYLDQAEIEALFTPVVPE